MAKKQTPRLSNQPPMRFGEIESSIFLIREQRVMIDADLAELYQVPTRVLNQAVRRNSARFPQDFMFQLTAEEAESLRSQTVISKVGRGGRRYLPHAFTEHGVAMLSSVLTSARAVQMNIVIVRAFIRLREVVVAHKDLANRLEKVEATQRQHGSIITAVVQEIERLKTPSPITPKRRIGYTPEEP